jgi:DnaJ-class molecular chaperone
LNYDIRLDKEDARRGTSLDISVDRGGGRETLKVKVPAGTRPGTRLRLRGKGRRLGGATGDMYLQIYLK